MKIRLIGQANHTGVGTHFREFAEAIRQHRPDVPLSLCDPFDDREVLEAIGQSQAEDINICFTAHQISMLKGRMIQWVPFETTRIPNMICEPLRSANEVWTMTEWSRTILLDHGLDPDKIVVMPQGVDSLFSPAKDPISLPVINFLMVAKYEQRKGFRETIKSWAQTLKNDQRYCLRIKSHGTTDDRSGFDELVGNIRDLGIENYQVIWGGMSEQDMVDLYRSSQVLIVPTYGEGWGRPIMEAAAMGLPIITTRYSAHGEWLQAIADSVCWVDHDLVDVVDRDYERSYGGQDCGQWAQPSLDSLIKSIEQVKDDLGSLIDRARSNSQRIHEIYDWSKIVDLALDRLGLFSQKTSG